MELNSQSVTAAQAIDIALAHHRAGRLPEAEGIYRKVLLADPENPEALHLLGVAAHQRGAHQAAVDLIESAVRLVSPRPELLANLAAAYGALGRTAEAESQYRMAVSAAPGFAPASVGLARLLRQRGRMDEAAQCMRELLAVDANCGEAHCDLGVVLLELGRVPEAEQHIRRALALLPGNAEILYNLGNVLRAARQPGDAEQCYRRALAVRPAFALASNNLGTVLKELGRTDEAERSFREAVGADPRCAEAHFNLGSILRARRRGEEAEGWIRRALALRPSYADAHNELGRLLHSRGRLEEAERSLREALAHEPQSVQAYDDLGILLHDLGRLGEAEQALRKALTLNPSYAEAHNNLGVVLRSLGRLEEAEASFLRSVQLKPDHASAWSNLAETQKDAGRVEEALAGFRRAVEIEPGNAWMHSNLLLALHYRQDQTPEQVFREHVLWAQRHAAGLKSGCAFPRRDSTPERKLRIGYISPDFRRHSVAYFLQPVLAAHDRAKFEVFCYSNVRNGDAVTTELRGLSDEWRDVSRLLDEDVAELVARDGIDILVDLAGHTDGGMPLVLARRPAPVQVAWLGYPNTTGLAAIDFRLTDPVADPPGETERYHTETLYRLTRGFLCFRPAQGSPEVSDLPMRTKGHVTFGCFNHLAKITPAMVALWSKVLRELPDARIVIKNFGLNSQAARRRLADLFERNGIASDRLSLRSLEPSHLEHLAMYGEIDIGLDVFPYNGATTTCEALWMGVPVVTLAGATHVARVGASILNGVGLSELVASTPEDYIEKVIRVARDADTLCDMRIGMRDRLRKTALLDQSGFTRDLETAYHEMWSMAAKGKPGMPSNGKSGSTGQDAFPESLRLHIGGTERKAGWKIFSIQEGPAVDYVGDCADLTRFADGSVDEIYASHVLEHLGYREKLPKALKEFHRVLKPGAAVRISVPDFEALCRMFLDPARTWAERFYIMRMAFGGQLDEHDVHYVGLTYDFLHAFLGAAGFSRIERVGEFGLFDDASSFSYLGTPVSLNVIAVK